jgi:putative addiction module component (TIGR02574 family)
MTVNLPLEKMTVREKLRLMEELWQDLSRDPDQFKSPDWHEAEMKKRKASIASGKAKFIDWEKAKKELRRLAK